MSVSGYRLVHARGERVRSKAVLFSVNNAQLRKLIGFGRIKRVKFGRLAQDFDSSDVGSGSQSHRFGRVPLTSGLPRTTDINRPWCQLQTSATH